MILSLIFTLASSRPFGDTYYQLPPIYLNAGTGPAAPMAPATGLGAYPGVMSPGMYNGIEDEYTWEKIYDDLNMDDWFDNDFYKYSPPFMPPAVPAPALAVPAYNPVMSVPAAPAPLTMYSQAYTGAAAYGAPAYGAPAPQIRAPMAAMAAPAVPPMPAFNPYAAYSTYGYGSPMFYDYDMFDNDWWDMWDDGGLTGPRDCTKYESRHRCHGKTTKGHCIWNTNSDSCVDCANGDQACLCQRYDEAHGKQFCIKNNNCAWSMTQRRCGKKAEVPVEDRAAAAKKQKPSTVDNCHNFLDAEECFGLTHDGFRCFWNAYNAECAEVSKDDFFDGLCGIHGSARRCLAERRQGVVCDFVEDKCIAKNRPLPSVNPVKPVVQKDVPVGQKPIPQRYSNVNTPIHNGDGLTPKSRLRKSKSESVETVTETNPINKYFYPLMVLLGISLALNVVGWSYVCSSQQKHRSKSLLEDVHMEDTYVEAQ